MIEWDPWQEDPDKRMLKRYLHLPEGEYAIIDCLEKIIKCATERAWKWLRYQDVGPDGSFRTYPAEAKGPIPLIPYPEGEERRR